MKRTCGLAAAVAAAVITVPLGGAGATGLTETIDLVAAANMAQVKSQKRVDDTAEDTYKLLSEYRDLQKRTESMQVYVAQIEKLIAAQEAEMTDLHTQIDSATQIGREITPLMLRMIDSLDRFVQLDVPFLLKERRDRVQGLRDLVNRADVADSEKYRRILEAYQIENEFGRTIEAYSGHLQGEDNRTVSFLRIGRVALYYLTLDESECGEWSRENHRFERLPSDYRDAIKQGLRIAQKQTSPDLLRLPVPAPEDAQ